MTNSTESYDIAFLGHYTQDTIISASGTRLVDGGACNYGANVAARMGLKTAAITRLSQDDFHVAHALRELGVDVFARVTPRSTCLRLEYPTSNVDERVIYVTSTAGAFTPPEVEVIQAKAFLIGASMRGEVGLDVIQELGKKTRCSPPTCRASYAWNGTGYLPPRRGQKRNGLWPTWTC